MNKYGFYCDSTGVPLEPTLDPEDGIYILLSDFNKFRAKIMTAIDDNDHLDAIDAHWLKALIESDIPL
jgi:hypothetical protein